jgi:hypothetical protein
MLKQNPKSHEFYIRQTSIGICCAYLSDRFPGWQPVEPTPRDVRDGIVMTVRPHFGHNRMANIRLASFLV